MHAAPSLPLAAAHRHPPAQRSRRGLTLLELVIGLAVVAVLSAMAWPSLHGRLAREKLNTAAQALHADLTEARFEAARRGQTLHVVVSAGPLWCWSVAATPGCDCALPQACQLQAVRAKDHPGLQLLGASVTRLNADGAADGDFSTTLENRSHEQLRVSLSPLGRARICTARGTATRHPAC